MTKLKKKFTLNSTSNKSKFKPESKPKSKFTFSWWKDTHMAIKVLIIAVVIIVIGGIGYFAYTLIDNLLKAGKDVLTPLAKTFAALTSDVQGCITKSVVNITIKNPGKGYISSPTVTLVGGADEKSGSGSPTYTATAGALIDKKSGEITNIRLTDTGSGYKSIPTVVLSGGGKGGGDPTTPATATATIGGGPFSSWGCAGFLFAGIAYLLASIVNIFRKKTATEKALDAESEKGDGSDKLNKAELEQREAEEKANEETPADKAEKKYIDDYKAAHDGKDPSPTEIDAVRQMAENKVYSESAKEKILKDSSKTGQAEAENLNKITAATETMNNIIAEEKIENKADQELAKEAVKDGTGEAEAEVPEGPRVVEKEILRDSFNTCTPHPLATGGCCGQTTPEWCKAWAKPK